MSRSTKIWITIASLLVLLGSMAFMGAMMMMEWNFKDLSTNKYETNEYTITEKFDSISVKVSTADIKFVASEAEECTVVCYEQEKEKHIVTVRDGMFVIEAENTKKWYDYVGINFGTPKVTVHIPRGEYGDVFVKSNTGDIEIPKELEFDSIDISENTGDVACYASALNGVRIKTSTGSIVVDGISAKSLELSASTGRIKAVNSKLAEDVHVSVSTGKTYLHDLQCRSLITEGSTGDITLKSVIASERLSIERSTGDVELEGSDAGEIYIKTDTGDVEGSILTEKIFIVRTDTGKIKVPSSANGGRCEITTDTGDIKINLVTYPHENE